MYSIAAEALQREHAQLQQRVHSLEQQLESCDTQLQMFRHMVEQAHHSSLFVDCAGCIIYANVACQHLLSFIQPSPLVGLLLREVLPALSDDLDTICATALHEGSHQQRLLLPTSEHPLPVMVVAVVIFDQHQNPQGVSLTMTDMSEQTATEEALHESRMLLRSFLDHAPTPMAVTDTEGRFLLANQPTLDVLGFDYEYQVLQQPLRHLGHPELGARYLEYVQHILASGAAVNYDFTIQHEQNSYTASSVSFPIYNSYGGVIAIGSIGVDATAYKQAMQDLQESEERIDLALRGAALGLWDWNVQTGELVFNDQWATMLGYCLDDLTTHINTWWQVIHPEDRPLVEARLQAHLDGHTPFFDAEYRVVTCDGTWKWCATRSALLARDADGRPLRVTGIHRDVTSEKDAEASLHLRVRELDALRATMAEISGELDLDTLLQAIVERAADLAGATSGMLCLYDPLHSDLQVQVSYNLPRDYTGMRLALGEDAMGLVGITHESLIIDNSSNWHGRSSKFDSLPPMHMLLAPLLAGGRLVGVICLGNTNLDTHFAHSDEELLGLFAQQATIAIKNARMFTEIQQLATTDSLTGLFNRRHFFTLAQREFARARRYDRPLAVIMLDVDNFKQVNDDYGHASGDQALQSVAGQCRSTLRSIDLVGRYGGEELIMLLPDTDRDGAFQVAERLRRAVLQNPIRIARGHLLLTISLGVAVSYHDNVSTLDALIDRADQALYVVKRSAKNGVFVWGDVVDEPIIDRNTRETQDTSDEALVRAEALLRLSQRASTHLDLETVQQVICQETARALQTPYSVLQLYNQAHDNLPIVAASGISSDILHTAVPTPRAIIDDLRRRNGAIVIVPDVRGSRMRPNSHLHQQIDARTLVSVPLLDGERMLGMLSVLTCGETRIFTPEELTLLEDIAYHAMLTLRNSLAYQALQQTLDATLAAWASGWDQHTGLPSTYTHNVAALLVQLAQALGLEAHDYDDLRRGAWLHAFGQLTVPIDVLCAGEQRSSEQRALIATAPLRASDLLAGAPLLKQALAVPSACDEHWDGSGTPRELRAEAIPLAARMFAVVNTWEYWRTNTPPEAWNDAAAQALLRDLAGTQFDPHIVEVFIDLLKHRQPQAEAAAARAS